jgi:hypothetical protein
MAGTSLGRQDGRDLNNLDEQHRVLGSFIKDGLEMDKAPLGSPASSGRPVSVRRVRYSARTGPSRPRRVVTTGPGDSAGRRDRP